MTDRIHGCYPDHNNTSCNHSVDESLSLNRIVNSYKICAFYTLALCC